MMRSFVAFRPNERLQGWFVKPAVSRSGVQEPEKCRGDFTGDGLSPAPRGRSAYFIPVIRAEAGLRKTCRGH